MTQTLLPLSGIAEFDEALRKSFEHPVVIFKHSPTCGTSAHAFENVETWLETGTTPTYLVTPQANREVSNEIARRLSVRHETPQVLVVRNGQVRWHASHYRVTAEALDLAVKE